MTRRKQRKPAGELILITAIELLAAVFLFNISINGVGNILENSIEKQTKTSLDNTKRNQFLENINPFYSSTSQSKKGNSYLDINKMQPPNLSAKGKSYLDINKMQPPNLSAKGKSYLDINKMQLSSQ